MKARLTVLLALAMLLAGCEAFDKQATAEYEAATSPITASLFIVSRDGVSPLEG